MTPTDSQLADLAARLTRLEVLVRQLQAAVKAMGGTP
jgi:hypothetical protein